MFLKKKSENHLQSNNKEFSYYARFYKAEGVEGTEGEWGGKGRGGNQWLPGGDCYDGPR